MNLFGTAGIRGPVRDRVTPELAQRVGRAVALDAGTASSVVVGRDGRTTGEGLAAAVTAGLESGGADVVRVGQVPTPALAWASRDRRGVMLTASHNPPHDNGLKLFADGEEYDATAEEAVESRVATDPDPVAWDRWGSTFRQSVLPDYRAGVVDYAHSRFGDTHPFADLRVAVDCGNGMASLATPQVLRELGADVVTLNANVDGSFPGRESKPTAESLRDLRAFVADDGADLGLGHDGDADRIVVVGPGGEVVHEDTVVAVLAYHYVATSDADDPVVVTTPNASGRIDERVAAAGGRVERVRLGALHEGIARERAAGDDDTAVVFAAEPWKHVHTLLGGWIDGVVSAAVVSGLVADAGGVSSLVAAVTERPYRKVSVACPDDDKAAAMATVTERLPDRVSGAVNTDHGVRVDRADGSWVLVRPSGTEPYVRIYAESEDVDDLVETARGVVEDAVESA